MVAKNSAASAIVLLFICDYFFEFYDTTKLAIILRKTMAKSKLFGECNCFYSFPLLLKE